MSNWIPVISDHKDLVERYRLTVHVIYEAIMTEDTKDYKLGNVYEFSDEILVEVSSLKDTDAVLFEIRAAIIKKSKNYVDCKWILEHSKFKITDIEDISRLGDDMLYKMQQLIRGK